MFIGDSAPKATFTDEKSPTTNTKMENDKKRELVELENQKKKKKKENDNRQ